MKPKAGTSAPRHAKAKPPPNPAATGALPDRGAATRAAAERGGSNGPAPGRPKPDQPPDPARTGSLPVPGAATRAAAERGGQHSIHDYLGYLLGQANHALFKDFEAAVREAGLGSLEWRVLATLSDQAPMSIGQLAQEVLSQQPTVTKLVQRLEASAWVALMDDPKDQRRTLVQITSAGQRKVSPLIEQSREHEDRALSGLSASDITQLKAQLRRLAQQQLS
jgi:DNA-binding MarR family transcriptional regulator